MIPSGAERPRDGRRRDESPDRRKDESPDRRKDENREGENGFGGSLLRKSPFLDMTDLYQVPGTADEVAESLSHIPESQALFRAEIAYSRGEIDKVYVQAKHFLKQQGSFYSIISGGMLLALVAMWKGDLLLWREAHRHFYEASCKTEVDREIIELTLAATDSAIRDTGGYPKWFERGCFDKLPRDAHPAAKVYYIKHLLIAAQELAMGKIRLDGVQGLGLMKTLPYIVEPMISQMVVERVVMAEIYLRLLISIAYHQCGEDSYAAEHLDKAIKLCLADGLYGPLCEHRRQLGIFMDDRIALIDPEAKRKVKQMHRQLHEGWVKLHNAVLDRRVQVSLSEREREVVRLASYAMTDAQIAAQLHISVSSVKSAIRMAKNKTGVDLRNELALFI